MSESDTQWTSLQDERRASRRIPIAWRARARWGDHDHFEDCRTVDISKGGLCLRCTRPFTVGAEVQLALLVPSVGGGGGNQTAVARAKVVFQVLSGQDYRISLQWRDQAALASGPLGAWLDRVGT